VTVHTLLLHKIQFEINAVHLNFLFYTFYQVLNKKVSQFTQKILSSTLIITTTKKFILSSKSPYKNDFLRIMWHWRLKEWLLKILLN